MTHRRTRAVAWLATWAFLVQVLMPVAQGLPVPGDGAGGYLVPCKAFGPPEVVPTGSSGGPEGDTAVEFECPVCTAAAFGTALVVPEGADWCPTLEATDGVRQRPAKARLASAPFLRPDVRAPPLVS